MLKIKGVLSFDTFFGQNSEENYIIYQIFILINVEIIEISFFQLQNHTAECRSMIIP